MPAPAEPPAAGSAPGPVDCVIEDPRWAALGLEELADSAARATLARLGLDPGNVEISLLATDNARVAQLNRAFRGMDRPTNVLSWPAVERRPKAPGAPPPPPGPEETELGDIALAWETCAKEAAAAGLAPGDHVRHLVVHGLLHLLGYEHECDEDAALMEGLETAILASMGVADPYRDKE